ncbi:MAG: hypothetical protein J6S66_05075 [Bacteroidales bacterium]|nr:hypothetical protein [Bacteroidales bacterium]
MLSGWRQDTNNSANKKTMNHYALFDKKRLTLHDLERFSRKMKQKLTYRVPETEILGAELERGVLAGAVSGGFDNPRTDDGFPGEDED